MYIWETVKKGEEGTNLVLPGNTVENHENPKSCFEI
jgi:hypothetical protein